MSSSIQTYIKLQSKMFQIFCFYVYYKHNQPYMNNFIQSKFSSQQK